MSPEADRVWSDSMPEAYERALVPALFEPFAAALAARAHALGPADVLELAAGTGVVTRHLVRELPGAQVTATDLNPAMVKVGAAVVPGASWRQADALDLPFPDESADLVVCAFGVMFFPDKSAAFAEMRRVLRPAGRVLLSIWGDLADHGFDAAMIAGLRRAFPTDSPDFLARVPHGYTDLDTIAADVADGGLSLVAVEVVTLSGTAPSAREIAEGYCTGTPVRAEIEERGEVATTLDIVTEVMVERFGGGPVTTTMAAIFVEATLA